MILPLWSRSRYRCTGIDWGRRRASNTETAETPKSRQIRTKKAKSGSNVRVFLCDDRTNDNSDSAWPEKTPERPSENGQMTIVMSSRRKDKRFVPNDDLSAHHTPKERTNEE
ncbi:hypothetical protein DAKH74_021010 [Maudiozyma humilis]|uniref:Uncharacterized protein n=1 Tax=Maudiozyma humilis TaxID=51915 RepID=A0AAV5RVL7_MAUHU|nr:hypothetical protein DAKH74_021010 [Kazachstania humilis]